MQIPCFECTKIQRRENGWKIKIDFNDESHFHLNPSPANSNGIIISFWWIQLSVELVFAFFSLPFVVRLQSGVHFISFHYISRQCMAWHVARAQILRQPKKNRVRNVWKECGMILSGAKGAWHQMQKISRAQERVLFVINIARQHQPQQQHQR